MKKILFIVLSLIVLGAIGYGIFYLISSDPRESGSSEGKLTGLSADISDNQAIWEWREENRTGVSSETGLMKSWPADGPMLIWSNVTLPKGHSSPAFGNNTIYITGNYDENDILVAIDSAGGIKWQTEYGRVWKASHPESRCTPTIEGTRVYVTSGYGDVACIDGISGNIIWQAKSSEENKGTYGPWGIAESVIIDGEKLYFATGGPETTTIALDKNTGETIWKTESLGDPASYISPIMIEYPGLKLLVNITPRYVFAVDVSTGTIIWKVHHPQALGKKDLDDDGQIMCVTPLFHNDKLYITGGYDHGAVMIDISDQGRKASVAWTDKVLDVHHGGVVLVDGYIYGANWLNNGNGNWCCIDWNTGRKMYEEHWKCKGSIISAGGMLYIYDEKTGFAGLVKPNPEKFELVSSFKVKGGTGPYWAHPVINNGVLYLRHGEALNAYDIKEK